MATLVFSAPTFVPAPRSGLGRRRHGERALPLAPRLLLVAHALLGGALAAAILAVPPAAHAQQTDRERAQLLQLQQQLQRLQADNASLQKERSELQSKAQDADKLKQSAAKTSKDLSQARALSKQQAQDLTGLRAELATTREQLDAARAQNLGLRKALAERDDRLAAAAADRRRLDDSQNLLEARLRAQTGRGVLCEARHEGLMKFSASLIDRYESQRLRLCEPVTGIWKVAEQSRIQALRESLYGFRLDIPAPRAPAAAAAAASATAATAAPAAGAVPAAAMPDASNTPDASSMAPAH